jgi:uncharacterized protein involved in exopolysaccharide biosynthesis/Mrp family chromosome partitioning ATPase
MAGENSSNRDVDIDLGRLVVAIWERKGRIALATILAGGVAFVVSSMMSPQYKGEARVLIESRAASFGATQQSGNPTEPILDELNIVSQSQIIQSVDLIKRVAGDMKLYEREEFDPDANPSAISNLLVTLGLKRNPLAVPPEERVLKAFREKLQVYQVESSRVIAVEFSSEDPTLAAAIPNEMLKVYLSLQSGAKLDTSTEAAKWLEPEIASLREKVREADRKVADYRSSSDLLRVGEGNTFATRQLSDISTELARIRSEKANAEARAQNVRNALASGRPLDTFSDVVGSQMIQRLKESEAAIQGQISDLSTSMLEGHPRIKGLRAQLEGIRQQIASETRKILASLENEANVARLRETQLGQQLNVLKSESARAGEQEVGLNDLEREASAQRQLLETYLARYREATSRAGSQDSTPADARVISAAVEPREAYFPKVGAIVVVAALATFLLSCIVVMLLELFSGRALKPVGASAVIARKDERDDVAAVPAVAAAPVAGVVARKDVEPVAVVEEPAQPDESYGDFSVDAIADFLALRGAKPVVVVISPTGDDGSTATVMLARAMSELGRSVVLVDMTASACPTRLMASESGLLGVMDLLAGDAAFGETIHHDRLSSAHIVPQGNAQPHKAMKVVDRLTMVVGALSDAYDTVLVECGAVQIESAVKILKHLQAEIVVSVPDANPETIEKTLTELKDQNYPEAMPMTGIRSRRHQTAA